MEFKNTQEKNESEPKQEMPLERKEEKWNQNKILQKYTKRQRTYKDIIYKLQYKYLSDEQRHEYFYLAMQLIQLMIKDSPQCMREARKVYLSPLRKNRILMYLRALSLLKHEQVHCLMIHSEREKIQEYQHTVDILEYTSEFFRIKFGRWRNANHLRPRYNRLPLPYT